MVPRATKAVSGRTGYASMGKLAASVLLIAIGVWWAVRMSSVMSDVAASNPNMAQTKTGGTANILIEVTEAKGGELRGKILKEKSKEVYARTGDQISVHPNAETKYVMGKAKDVQAGAVAHVTGVMQEDRSVAAQQIVILTGYVKVE